jgi:L-threonylcarbamoyladenylate synthase
MIRLDINELLLDKNITRVRQIINNHGLICYPTDTLYGLGGNFHSRIAGNKIDCLKKRRELPYSVAISGIRMLDSLVETIPEVFHTLARELIPGKFTFLLPACSRLPISLLRNSTKIGIRIPDLPEILELISILDLPIISTSVNRTGQTPLNDPDLIAAQFPEIDLLIDSGPLKKSWGSTILDLTQIPITCIRRGDDFDKLESLDIRIEFN